MGRRWLALGSLVCEDGLRVIFMGESLMQVLVVDVGGTHIKILVTGETEHRRFGLGPTMTAAEIVAGVLAAADGWKFKAVSIGYPGPVLRGKPVCEPHNLGPGWVGFDFEARVRMSCQTHQRRGHASPGELSGRKMLFLGLGTGLGSAMIVDGVVEPMELSHLPYRKATYEDYVGYAGS